MSAPTMKCIIIGDLGVGKTSIISRFVDDEFSEKPATIGVEQKLATIKVPGLQSNLKIFLADTAGQEAFESVTRQFYRRSSSIIIAYDITNKKSFENVDKWHTEATSIESGCNMFVLAGCKKDLEERREVSQEEGRKAAEKIGATFFEVSAKTNENINKMFVNLGTTFARDLAPVPNVNDFDSRVFNFAEKSGRK